MTKLTSKKPDLYQEYFPILTHITFQNAHQNYEIPEAIADPQ